MSSSRCFLTAMGIIALASFGCSVDGQITDTTKRTFIPTVSRLTGVASGSFQQVTTSNNYTVSSSVGSPYGGDIVTTTANGYQVYSSIQGNLAAETGITVTE